VRSTSSSVRSSRIDEGGNKLELTGLVHNGFRGYETVAQALHG